MSDCSTHLEITRDATCRNPVSTCLLGKISVGRRTLYALMGAGLHGLNGLHPSVSYHIYTIYVIPRMLSGLESIVPSKKDIQELELFHRSVLRNIQHLPKNAACAAVYTLLGAMPVEGILDIRCITLYGAATRCPGSTIHNLAHQQLLHKDDLPPKSWFKRVAQLHEKYSLPHPLAVLESGTTKQQWKHKVSRAVKLYWEEKLQLEVTSKSSLAYLSKTACNLGKPHKLWSTVNFDKRDIRRACIKAELLCGTYNLQVNRSKFNQYDVNPQCPMCHTAAEDRPHFLRHCPSLQLPRSIYLPRLRSLLPPEVDAGCSTDDDLMPQIILNCPRSVVMAQTQFNLKWTALECASRHLCYALHHKRAYLMSYRP